jgi:voltage-gated potassium channel
LLTVGYGDIYPVTTMGKIFGIFIAFLGVGMVAIPTGIISAGFVDQYSRLKRIGEYGQEEEVHFIRIRLNKNDDWVNHRIADLHLPQRIIVAVVQRDHRILVPKGDTVLKAGDVMVIGAESFQDKDHIKLKEITLQQRNPWTDQKIRDLDISRHSIIVLVKRQGKMIIPSGNLTLLEGDTVVLYTQTYMANADDLEI